MGMVIGDNARSALDATVSAVSEVHARDAATAGISARQALEVPPRPGRVAVVVEPGSRRLKPAAADAAHDRALDAGAHVTFDARRAWGWVIPEEAHGWLLAERRHGACKRVAATVRHCGQRP